MITLYESGEREFKSNGIGSLSSATQCFVVEELNGTFELEMQYPTDGALYDQIKMRRIIFAKSSELSEGQPFRIYAISKPINRLVTVSACHISYDLSGIPVKPFKATSATDAFNKLKTMSAISNPFTFQTSATDSGEINVEVPVSVRSVMGNNIMRAYKGEYVFDKYLVKHVDSRGAKRGTRIRYGKNLTDVKQDENINNVYTGVFPFWKGEIYNSETEDYDKKYITLPEEIVKVPGEFGFERVLTLNAGEHFTQKEPTVEELRKYANEYITDNKLGVPEINIDVSFIQLYKADKYNTSSEMIEIVELGDTVEVDFTEIGILADSKCVKTTFDVIRDRYDSLELGSSKSRMSDTIVSDKEATDDKLNNAADSNNKQWSVYLQEAKDAATNMINEGLKNSHVLVRPNEFLVMDTPNINTATKVWRWNASGLGFSSNGYGGTYGTAITADGGIVADKINTGTMTASRVRTGIIQGHNMSVNLDTGVISASLSDGSELIISPQDGFFNKRGSDKKPYHHLMYSSEAVITGDIGETDVTIQIPDYFRGKDFSVVTGVQNTGNISSNGIKNIWCQVRSIDRVKGTFTVRAYCLLVNDVYVNIQFGYTVIA